ncbi:MAG: type II toxin-antitoxin system RelE/ParE family toxin [Desulfobacteraceae bacterium]
MTKTYQVNLTQQAQNDLEHIFYYIADDSIKNAENFVRQLEIKIISLETSPARNPFIPENEFFDTEYRHLLHKNYRIIYRTAKESVFVLRIIHGAQLLKL